MKNKKLRELIEEKKQKSQKSDYLEYENLDIKANEKAVEDQIYNRTTLDDEVIPKRLDFIFDDEDKNTDIQTDEIVDDDVTPVVNYQEPFSDDPQMVEVDFVNLNEEFFNEKDNKFLITKVVLAGLIIIFAFFLYSEIDDYIKIHQVEEDTDNMMKIVRNIDEIQNKNFIVSFEDGDDVRTFNHVDGIIDANYGPEEYKIYLDDNKIEKLEYNGLVVPIEDYKQLKSTFSETYFSSLKFTLTDIVKNVENKNMYAIVNEDDFTKYKINYNDGWIILYEDDDNTYMDLIGDSNIHYKISKELSGDDDEN